MLKHARKMHSCSICNSSKYEVIYRSRRSTDDQELGIDEETYRCTSTTATMNADVIGCSLCGQVRLNPQPDSESLYQLSKTLEDPIYLKQVASHRKTFAIALKRMDRKFPVDNKSEYLDLSCYYGIFVETLFQFKRRATGVDICSAVVQQGNDRLGRTCLYSGRVEDWPRILKGKKFDRITSWDALEHVPNPVEYLQIARDLLTDDGLLVLSTMNRGSMVARIMGRHWPWIMPMHLYYYSQQTIENILTRAGFCLIQVDTYTHVVTLSYLMYKLFPRVFSKFINHWPLNKVFIRVNLGDFMTVYARRLG